MKANDARKYLEISRIAGTVFTGIACYLIIGSQNSYNLDSHTQGWGLVASFLGICLFMFCFYIYRTKYFDCPNCNKSISFLEKWQCDYCNKFQKKETSILLQCGHCKRHLSLIFCEHCHKEVKL